MLSYVTYVVVVGMRQSADLGASIYILIYLEEDIGAWSCGGIAQGV